MRDGRSSSARGGAAAFQACAPSFPPEKVGDGPAAFQDRRARMRACKVRSRASPVHVFLLTGLLEHFPFPCSEPRAEQVPTCREPARFLGV